MTTDSLLIQKREDLKRQLAAGEYKTLVDLFLNRFEYLLRKIAHRSNPFSLWFVTLILNLVVIAISLAEIYVGGNLAAMYKLFQLYGTLGILAIISTGILVILSGIITNQYIRDIITLWHNEILDITESIASLEEFETWLKNTCNQRFQFLVLIIGGLFFTAFLTVIMSVQLGIFIGYGAIFTNIIPSLFGSIFLYLFIRVIVLSSRLRKYNMKLFALDPSSSELTSRLSNKLSLIVYFVAAYAVATTLASAATGSLQSVSIFLVVILWVPIVILFTLNQTSLASIIRRAKWKTLNEIQSQVEELRTTGSLKDKETIEAINRLMDFHDRVKATRNSAIDSSTIINFINSLLLPLLAFLLGNLDKVLPFFSRRP